MKTIGQLKSKLKSFTCIEEENFITDEELNCFIDMAQKKAATKIACLNKEYFTSMVEMPLAVGEEFLVLPEDIRATRVKAVLYRRNENKVCYRIKRADYKCVFSEYKSTPCEYYFMNVKGEGHRLYLNPLPNTDGQVTIVYERKPCDIEADAPNSTELEFEEMCDYIFQYVKLKIYEKTRNPLASLTLGELNEAEQDMLECMCPQFGDDCEVRPDREWSGYVDEGYGYGNYGGYGGGGYGW